MSFVQNFLKRKDLLSYRMLLHLKKDRVVNFFDCGGCGLEIEFGLVYERRCRVYIRNGLERIKEVVGDKGKFVLDRSIGHDLNIEIVLWPFYKEELKELFGNIKEIITYYENFVYDSNCGIHANFRADDDLKEAFYNALAAGAYDPKRFSHSKYKVAFTDIISRGKNGTMTYQEYVDYQNNVAGKYISVNFLKPQIIEFRSMTFSWHDIEYIYDVFHRVKEEFENSKKIS